MKYSIIVLAILLSNCTTYFTPDSDDLSKNLLVRVECRSSQQAETSVIQSLKMARYNDLEKQNDGTMLTVKARYEELPYEKAMLLIDRLKGIPEVMDVQIIRDGIPVKNIVRFNN